MVKKKKPPLISIIIPTLNAAKYLQTALDSVISNAYPAKELIVVDGCSVDETVQVIKRNQAFIASWISEPDNGIYDAMEKGVQLAKGDWIYFLGADDKLVNCLEEVSKHLRNPKRIYYGNSYFLTSNTVYDGKFTWVKLLKKNICHQSIFYPRAVFSEYKFDPQYKVLGDYDLNIRCWAENKYKFVYIPVLVGIYNDSGFSAIDGGVDYMRIRQNTVETFFHRQLKIRRFFRRILRNLKPTNLCV